MSQSRQKIHLISIGGSVMHNIAIALKEQGHKVSGSDDEIYEPSRGRLEKHNLLPANMGWDANNISEDLDMVILGMHAREDNPELLRAKELNIPILSFPDLIYKLSEDKQRIVIAGSHGKTTITAIIIHVLNFHNRKCDYAVGASIKGLENSVKFSEAPIIIIEGDEYLTSPIDRVPKFLKYNHHIGLISGISWDHMNVFPSEEEYVRQFDRFADATPKAGKLIYNGDDAMTSVVAGKERDDVIALSYKTPEYKIQEGQVYLIHDGNKIPLKIFGEHNLQNLEGARQVLKNIAVTDEMFNEAIQSFEGAGKRLEEISSNGDFAVFSDYAHAPSKVKATVKAMKKQFPSRDLVACLELHTFSSLNSKFLPNYKNVMHDADEALIYYNPENLKRKKLEQLTPEDIKNKFSHKNLTVFTERDQLERFLNEKNWENKNLLLMSSGTFDKLDIERLVEELESKSN